jgi:hypothetical protein
LRFGIGTNGRLPSGLRGALLMFAGAIWTLLASALGFAAARAGERRERRRARRTLATAMLAELRWLDMVLRRMVEHGPGGFEDPLEHPIIEAGLNDLTLFRPETAGRVSQFHTLLRSLQHDLRSFRDNPRPWTGRHAEFERLVKSRAALSCRAIPDLNGVLRKEGGLLPPAVQETTAGGETSLPPTPFGAGEGDDWTL